MSEEILAQESEETVEEEIVESSEQDSSDDLTEVEEGKTAKASVKKEEDDEEEEEEDSEEEEPAEEEKKVKKEAVSIPKTKNQMLKNIYDQVNGMLKGDLSAKYEEIMASTNLETVKEEEIKEEEVTRTKAAIKAEDIKIDVKDDVEALVQGEEGLSEEFKQKASTIFEAAVAAKVISEVNQRAERLEDDYKEELSKAKEELTSSMTEKTDGYLSYVVEEWMKENELAVERGVRSELVEDFMSGLKNLFTEHYIDIPE